MLGELIHSVLVFLEGLGYWGIMLGLMLEVIPSEIVLSYAGYLVSTGSITFLGAVAFGTIGGLIVTELVLFLQRVLFLLCVMLFRYQRVLRKCHMLSLLR